MILLDCTNFSKSPIALKMIYINILNNIILTKKQNKSLEASHILDIFSIKEILEALDFIIIDKNRNLKIQENTKASKILRYLEFGGEGVRPNHILSETKKIFVRGERRTDVL